MSRSIMGLCVLLLTGGLLACANGGNEVTADGLERLRRTGFRNAWVKPDATFSEYTQITLAEPTVSYRRTPRATRAGRSGPGNFALTEPQMALFKKLLVEAFASEFQRSQHFTLSSEPGPDVLRVEPAVIDLTVRVPTQGRAGRETILVTSTAEMTLLMELRDSESGEILARIADRQEARQAGRGFNDLYWSNTVSDVDAVRRTFRRWARILRERLDAVHSVGGDSGS
jgi:hypothetical protein